MCTKVFTLSLGLAPYGARRDQNTRAQLKFCRAPNQINKYTTRLLRNRCPASLSKSKLVVTRRASGRLVGVIARMAAAAARRRRATAALAPILLALRGATEQALALVLAPVGGQTLLRKTTLKVLQNRRFCSTCSRRYVP